MVPRKRIFLALLQDMVAYKRLKLFRYYVGIMLLDVMQRGEGRLKVDDTTIDTLSSWFQVKRETVIKNLNHLDKHGYGQTRDGYFYYTSQEKLAVLHTVKLSKSAVVFYPDDMIGDGVRWRALCTDKACAGDLNMSRSKRNEVYHQSPKTQRKYEGLVHTIVIENYLDLGSTVNSQVVEQAQQERSNLFVITDHEGKLGERGADHLMSRTVNTYQPATTSLENRRVKKPRISSTDETQGETNAKRLFFQGDNTRGGYEKAVKLHKLDPSVDRFVLKASIGKANYYNVLGRQMK